MGAVSVLGVLAVVLAGCSEGQTAAPTVKRKPVLSLTQTGPDTIDLGIAGPYALRAIQARVVYDASRVRLTKVEPGKDAARLDRVFFADPAAAEGDLRLGATDTRQVLLPARGALFRITVAPAVAGTNNATLAVEQALGVDQEGKAVTLVAVSAEVKLQ
jgi:hypothetical protein